MYYLSILTFFPMLLGIAFLLMGNIKLYTLRILSISAASLVVIFCIFLSYLWANQPSETFFFLENRTWFMLSIEGVGTYKAGYILGLDGIGLVLILLTAFVVFIALVYPYEIDKRQHTYVGLLFLLWGSVNGCFAALDLLLFYVFFEVMLLPMYFLIGIWGGERREYAAVKFLIYTLIGSLAILVAFLMLYVSSYDAAFLGESVRNNLQKLQVVPYSSFVHTLDWFQLKGGMALIPGSLLHGQGSVEILGLGIRSWAFILLMIGFCIKLPSFPFHTWLPDAHVEAPTPVSVVLASILLKIGAYGMFRFAFTIFPDVASDFAFELAALGVFSILYGSANALAMSDLKKLIAYSSIAHMGFFLLGMAAGTVLSISGAMYQLVSHGLISAGLFLVVGFIYHQTHHRGITDYRGLASEYPKLTFFHAAFAFAALGLPGMSGFIAEYLVLVGTFQSDLVPAYMVGLAALGIVLGAGYFLWSFQRMYFGPFWRLHTDTDFTDLKPVDIGMSLVLLVFIVLLGFFPDVLLQFFEAPVNHYLRFFN